MNYASVKKTNRKFTAPIAPLIRQRDAVKNIIRPKLKVGAPNDHFEQEADRVADQIIQMPDPTIDQKRVNNHSNMVRIQRSCSACAQDDERLQRKSHGSGGVAASDSISARISNTRGGGSNLDAGTKGFMESRFGRDFSGVRIHTDQHAVRLSRELSAHAFTVGDDIYFDQGKYNPTTTNGKRLLAHELVHTVHQANHVQGIIQRGFNPGRCCNRSETGADEWALVSGEGEDSPTVWQRLSVGECVGNYFGEGRDCEGMTCGGGFYVVQGWTTLLGPGTCRTPGKDDFFYEDNRWTPTDTGRADAASPVSRGSDEGNTPPGYTYYDIESS